MCEYNNEQILEQAEEYISERAPDITFEFISHRFTKREKVDLIS